MLLNYLIKSGEKGNRQFCYKRGIINSLGRIVDGQKDCQDS